ncbi:MAG TPA: penicillin acylase family protein, partial [Thermoanaerobaculia bacterium]|nr:penicillin acylase family protein [Thermoanaerobaculia bacterium]
MEPNRGSVPSSPAEAPAPTSPGPRRRPRKWLRRIGKGLVFLLGLVLVLAAASGLWLRSKLRASLPELEGERRVEGLAAPATVERDAAGIPTIQGASRRDVAFAEGYVHAQDRLFQMDLMRRQSAGELAELFGPGVVQADRDVRVHRFRARAARLLQESPPQVREILEAYAQGVNAGRASLGGDPFEYLAMRAKPSPWRAEDSFLVLFSMFMQLNDEEGMTERTLSQLREAVPPALFEFLTPQGTAWDSPLVGDRLPSPPVPGPQVCNVPARPAPAAEPKAASLTPPAPREVPGSNGWVVAGSHTADGGALLANELHLGLMVPNLWYRVSLSWPDGAGGRHRVTGVTLPGAPAMVLGSNGRVAWGVTNSAIDTTDLITLEVDPARPDTYRTPEGPRRFERHREVIRVKGGEEEAVDVDSTVWGPVSGKDWKGRPQVLRWTAYEPGAADFQILGLET